jgi:tRNA U38,U39,U40 pseudouridine synthase TruA
MAFFPAGVEANCHGLCDTVCLNVKHYAKSDEAWIDHMNSLMPSTVRILHRYTLTSDLYPREFHAEVSCNQQRYEYMLPLRLLMPAGDVATATTTTYNSHVDPDVTVPFSGSEEEKLPGLSLLQQPGNSAKLPIVINPKPYYGTAKQNRESTDVHSMSQQFPIETEEGQARVIFFRALKNVCKIMAGRKPFHNFASGGGSPEDVVTVRKIDRIYHKELVRIEEEPWAVFSVSGDSFLRGQIRHLIGLAVAIARGILPESYFEAAVQKGNVMEVPALPGWGLYLAECKYAYYEAKFDVFRLDPRRVPPLPAQEGVSAAESELAQTLAQTQQQHAARSDTSRLSAWRSRIHEHIAQIHRRCQQAGEDWLREFDGKCCAMLGRHLVMQALASRPRAVLEQRYQELFGRNPASLAVPGATAGAGGVTGEVAGGVTVNADAVAIRADGNSSALSAAVVAAYAKVLYLLRAADASGQWPANSTGRQKVIVNAPEVVDAPGTTPSDAADDADAGAAVAATAAASANKEVGEDAMDVDVAALVRNKQQQQQQEEEAEEREEREGIQEVFQTQNNDDNNDNDNESETDHSPELLQENQNSEKPLGKSKAPRKGKKGGDKNTPASKKQKPCKKRPVPVSNLDANGVPLPSANAHLPYMRIQQHAVEAISDPGVGGSFSVGCLPKHLAQPKGNALFPELMRACFELEKVLCPHRPPSSTIAINRHAQFSPHRDSGAGSGQSQSLIVALGDFAGGEIVVENQAHDIRYRPLEFDGWMQRHWTLPFVGERFSLVWFTPLGITDDDLWWWKE